MKCQAGIKIARSYTNNLEYRDDMTLMAESEEELKDLLMKVKVEDEKAGLKLNTQKNKTPHSASGSRWQNRRTCAHILLGQHQNYN